MMSTTSNMALIETKTVGAGGSASIEFTSIPQTGYTDLQVVVSLRMSSSQSPHAMISFNNANTSGFSLKNLIRYSTGTLISQSESAASLRGLYATLSGDTTNTFSNGSIYIPNYTSSTNKSISIDSVQADNSNDMDMGITAALWPYTNAITSLKLTADAGQSFVQGSTASLYGIKSVSKVLTPKATGGVISTSDDYVIHTFTASGTFTPTTNLSNVDYLVIAGGGGGGHGTGLPQFAGGGAGGLLQGSMSLNSGSYPVVIGAGGVRSGAANRYVSGWPTAADGIATTALGLTTVGGGGAGGGAGTSGWPGGSGGGQGGTGGGGTSPNNAAGTAGQGNAGGARSPNNDDAAGGGGGASSAGANGLNGVSGNGGNGITSSISGQSLGYAGGGGRLDNGYRAGFPGSPNGGVSSGSGGGGAEGNGGSGVVIIRYAI